MPAPRILGTAAALFLTATVLTASMPPNGGHAIRIVPVSGQ